MQGGKSGMRKRGRWMLVAREGRGCEVGGCRVARGVVWKFISEDVCVGSCSIL